MEYPVIRAWNLVHPWCRPLFSEFHDALQTENQANSFGEYRFGVFETYRTPQRQEKLFQDKNTKAHAFESPHQYGMAIDFVPYKTGGSPDLKLWTWDVPREHWNLMHNLARRYELIAGHMRWDMPHVVHPLWENTAEAWRKWSPPPGA